MMKLLAIIITIHLPNTFSDFSTFSNHLRNADLCERKRVWGEDDVVHHVDHSVGRHLDGHHGGRYGGHQDAQHDGHHNGDNAKSRFPSFGEKGWC